MVGITQQTIRLYEQRGLLHPSRTPGKTRLYTDEDVQLLEFIQHLTQEMGINLAGVEVILQLKKRIQVMQDDREKMLKLLYEAATMVQQYMDDARSTSLPVKSIIGCLAKLDQIK
jgi:MerR family transcriptional regulator, heat shock protein HspR